MMSRHDGSLRVVIAADELGFDDSRRIVSHLAKGITSDHPCIVLDRVPMVDGADGTIDAAIRGRYFPSRQR